MLGVSLCFSLLLAETAVRLLAPHSRDHVIPGGLVKFDTTLGWTLSPDQRSRHCSRYFNVIYETNAAGYRDRSRQRAIATGGRRILLYGDSMIFGWGIPLGERFSDLVEQQTPGVDMRNRAVPGYGLDQQILSYERDDDDIEADEVIMFVSLLTLERTRHSSMYRKPKPRFVIDDAGVLTVQVPGWASSRISDLLYRLVGRMYLPHFVELQLARFRMGQAARQPAVAQSHVPGNSAEHWLEDLHRRMLARARDVARRRGHRITLLSELPEPAEAELEAFCQREGLMHVPIGSGMTASDMVFGQHDRHWNSLANQYVADRLMSHIHGGLGTSVHSISPEAR